MPGSSYRVYAVRFATREVRRTQLFLGGDPRDEPATMDYFVWAAVNEERTVVVDTGFTHAVAERRKRELVRSPLDALRLIGVDPAAVEDVVLTHLHYDHTGTASEFPSARLHLQERELQFATGPHMRHPALGAAMELDDVLGLVRFAYDGRITFHDGDAEIAPGISVHLLGGHTAGLQVVRVETDRGPIVLASDASHYYENFEANRPFPVIFDVGQTLAGFETMRQLAASPQHIIPGHDPLVMARYPAPSPELEGIAVRLDVPPTAPQ